jgi:hypothetical protein
MASTRRPVRCCGLLALSRSPTTFAAEVPEAIKLHKRHLRVIMRALRAADGETAERELIAMLRQEADVVVGLLTIRGNRRR